MKKPVWRVIEGGQNYIDTGRDVTRAEYFEILAIFKGLME